MASGIRVPNDRSVPHSPEVLCKQPLQHPEYLIFILHLFGRESDPVYQQAEENRDITRKVEEPVTGSRRHQAACPCFLMLCQRLLTSCRRVSNFCRVSKSLAGRQGAPFGGWLSLI